MRRSTLVIAPLCAAASAALAAFAFTLAVAGEGAAPAAAPAPAATGLREVPAAQQEELRERCHAVTLTLRDGSVVKGVLRSYEPGEDGLPGLYLVTTEKTKPEGVELFYDIKVSRIELGEVFRDKPAHIEPPPEMTEAINEAIKAKGLEAFIAEHEARLRNSANVQQARVELGVLRLAYRRQDPEGERVQKRVMAAIESITDRQVREEVRQFGKGSRRWGRPDNKPEKPERPGQPAPPPQH